MKKSMYFPGLNGLRFYAAMSVIIAHTAMSYPELRPYSYGRESLFEWFFLSGYQAVNLFFVLSGFLITFLLFREREETGDISITRFYRRRILRIWPLYYLVALIGLVVLPTWFGHSVSLPVLTPAAIAGVLTLLPNLSNAVRGIGAIAPLWSLGIEEQYYLVWPHVIKRNRMWIAVAGIILFRSIAEAVVNRWGDAVLARVIWDTRFECMAMGAIGAWLYTYHKRACQIIYKPIAQGYFGLLFVLLIFFDLPNTVLMNLVTSVVFLVIILNVATNPRSLVKLENRTLRYLGDLSYGLYVWHYPILYLVMRSIQYTGALFDLWLYPLVIGFTLIAAALSHHYFEAPFLRRKAQFSPCANMLARETTTR